MKNIFCLFGKHKDGKKEISYIDEYGNHYMSKCQKCGADIFYENELEEAIDRLVYEGRRSDLRRRNI